MIGFLLRSEINALVWIETVFEPNHPSLLQVCDNQVEIRSRDCQIVRALLYRIKGGVTVGENPQQQLQHFALCKCDGIATGDNHQRIQTEALPHVGQHQSLRNLQSSVHSVTPQGEGCGVQNPYIPHRGHKHRNVTQSHEGRWQVCGKRRIRDQPRTSGGASGHQNTQIRHRGPVNDVDNCKHHS